MQLSQGADVYDISQSNESVESDPYREVVEKKLDQKSRLYPEEKATFIIPASEL